jgi:predicted transcriptional regulator
MNNLSSTNNNYYNNSNKFIILKGNSYTQKNLIKIYKKINQILKQELFLMIITYNKILKKLFQIKMKINKINFIVQRKMFSKIQ